MNEQLKKLAKKAGFSMRPHIEDIFDGVDWSPAGHGYDEVLKRFEMLVRQDERKQIALNGLAETSRELSK